VTDRLVLLATLAISILILARLGLQQRSTADLLLVPKVSRNRPPVATSNPGHVSAIGLHFNIARPLFRAFQRHAEHCPPVQRSRQSRLRPRIDFRPIAISSPRNLRRCPDVTGGSRSGSRNAPVDTSRYMSTPISADANRTPTWFLKERDAARVRDYQPLFVGKHHHLRPVPHIELR